MNFYVVLGVSREARLEDIRRAYRRLARRYHPGVNPGDREAALRFQEIAVAYETLSDPERRRRYDDGREGATPVLTSFEFQGFDFSTGPADARESTFGDLFSDALAEQEAAGAAPPDRGADVYATLTLSFEEAIRGGRHQVFLTRLERCAPCVGHGSVAVPEVPCANCDGTGHVRVARGHMLFQRRCAVCAGAGRVRRRACGACGGEGVAPHSGPVGLSIPPGIADATALAVPGEGHAGRRGGPAGALLLTVRVEPHAYFRRVGDDIWLEVPVAVHEAALGTRIDVPTPDGELRLRVPPGTQSGHAFRFQQRGVPRPQGGRGELVIIVRLVLPSILDERSRELMREFAAQNPEDVRGRWMQPSGSAVGPSTETAKGEN